MFLNIFKRSAKLAILSLALVSSLTAQSWRSYDCCSQDYCCDSGWLSLNRLSFGAEALFWKATEDNIAFANRISLIDTFNTGAIGDVVTQDFFEITRTKKEEHDFKWKTGFRFNIDYLLPCNNLDLGFTWTHFIGHARGHARAPNVTILNGNTESSTFLSPAFTNETQVVGDYDTIRSRWNLTFNNYELDIGRTCCCAPCFAIRPYIGVKYLQIKQKWHINSNAVPVTSPTGTEIVSEFDHQSLGSRFSGAGLQGGLCANWCLDYGFALYSNVSGGIAYGRSHSHRREFNHNRAEILNEAGEILTVIESNTINKDRDRGHVARPNLDFAVGLSWQHCLCNCYIVTVRAGWEYHHFFNQNFFRSSQLNNDLRGDLTLQGFTLGAGLDF